MEGAPPRPRIVTPAGLVELHRQQDPRRRGASARGPDMTADPRTARSPDANHRAAKEKGSPGDLGVFHHHSSAMRLSTCRSATVELCEVASRLVLYDEWC